MKQKQSSLSFGIIFILAFVLWTVLVSFVDLQPIGPQDSIVGLATFNGWFHSLTGVNLTLYQITDWLGLVPVAFGFGFGLLGLIQWIQRKKLTKVDVSLRLLGGYYLLVLFCYLFFEEVVINRRPVLLDGYLEASYPSSTTLLVLTVMPTALMQLTSRIQNRVLSQLVSSLILAFLLFMVFGRLWSGVHWISDIVGGILLSLSLVLFYDYFLSLQEK